MYFLDVCALVLNYRKESISISISHNEHTVTLMHALHIISVEAIGALYIVLYKSEYPIQNFGNPFI